jgi:hypothetical protein
VFNVFAENSLSIDMVATSEVSISLTLDQSQRNKLSKAVAVSQLAAIADVTEKSHVAIISLIANVERSSEVMAEVFGVMRSESIQVSAVLHVTACYCVCCAAVQYLLRLCMQYRDVIGADTVGSAMQYCALSCSESTQCYCYATAMYM